MRHKLEVDCVTTYSFAAKKPRRRKGIRSFGDGDGSFFDGWVAGVRSAGQASDRGHRAPMVGEKGRRDHLLVQRLTKDLPPHESRLEVDCSKGMHAQSRHVNLSLPPSMAWPSALSSAAQGLSQAPADTQTVKRPNTAWYSNIRHTQHQWTGHLGENQLFADAPVSLSTFRPQTADSGLESQRQLYAASSGTLARNRTGLFSSYAKWEAESAVCEEPSRTGAPSRPSTSVASGRGHVPSTTQIETLGGHIPVKVRKRVAGSSQAPLLQLQQRQELQWDALAAQATSMDKTHVHQMLYAVQGDASRVSNGEQDFTRRFSEDPGAAAAKSWLPPQLPLIAASPIRPKSAAGRFSMSKLARVPRQLHSAAHRAANAAQQRLERLKSAPAECEAVGLGPVVEDKSSPRSINRAIQDFAPEASHSDISPNNVELPFAQDKLYQLGAPATAVFAVDSHGTRRLESLSRQQVAANISVSTMSIPECLIDRISSDGSLDVSFFGLSSDDCDTLAASLPGKGTPVTSFNAKDNGLQGRSFSGLLTALTLQVELRHLDLSCNTILRPQMVILNRLLSATSRLTHLSLQNCGIKGELHTDLVDGCLSACLLQQLDLSHNFVSTAAAKKLAGLVAEHAELKSVRLDWCCMNEESTALIIDACIRNGENQGRLEAFSLEANKVDDVAGQRLASKLRTNTTLKAINLAKTGIGPRTAQVFASALQTKNSTLACVDLSQNRFGPAGTRALLRAAVRTSDEQVELRCSHEFVLSLAKQRNVPMDIAREVDSTLSNRLVAPRVILADIGLLQPLGGAFDPMFPEATDQGIYRLDCSKAWDQAVLDDILLALIHQPGFKIDSAQLSAAGSKQNIDFQVAVLQSPKLTQRLEEIKKSTQQKLDEAAKDRDAAGKLFGFMKKVAKDDMALRRADAMVQWRAQRNAILFQATAEVERLKRMSSYVTANGSRFEVPDAGVFTLKVVREPQQPTPGLNINRSQLGVILGYLTMRSMATSARLTLLRLIATDHWFDCEHAADVINRTAGAEETKYSGKLLHLRAECILTLITQLVEPREKDKLFSSTLEPAQISEFYSGAGALSRFQMTNPTGHYALNLTNEPDRKVALLLLQLNGADGLQRAKFNLTDPSQRGTANNFRNTSLNGRKVNLIRYLARHGELPSGVLSTDFVSTRRPEEDDAVADNLEVVALLNELSTFFGDAHDGVAAIEAFKAECRANGDTRTIMEAANTSQVASPRARERTKKRLFKALSFSIIAMKAPVKGGRTENSAQDSAPTASGSEAAVEIDVLDDTDGVAKAVLSVRPQTPPQPDPQDKKFEADWGSSAARRAQAKTIEQRWADWRKREPDPFEAMDVKMQVKFSERLNIALDHLRIASTEVFYTYDQAHAIVECFPQVPYLARARAIVVLFSRLWEVATAWKLMHLLSSSWAKHFVTEKLGYMNVFDPMSPKHSFELELTNKDDHRMAEMIVQLFSAESGTKFVDSSHNDLPGWQLPVSWLKEVPQEGHWCCTLVPPATGENTQVRLKLKAQTLSHADSLLPKRKNAV